MTPEGKIRIDQIRRGELPEGYKKTKAGVIPDRWSCCPIHACLNIFNHKRKPISEDERKAIPGPYPYYGPTQAQGYIATYESEGSAVLIGEDGDHFLKYKDREMTMYVDGRYTVNNHAHVLVGTDLCETKWFYYSYQHKSLFDAITRQGAGRYKLTKEALMKLPLQCPPLDEQRKIITILVIQDKIIELKENLLTEKQRQKKYLMQQLLTGKKRLPGFNGEWKTKLLKQLSEKQKKKNTAFQYSLVLSNSAQHGIVSQGQEFDKEIANEERIDGYYIVVPGAFVYNPRISVTAPCGPINVNETGEIGVMSPLYTVFTIFSPEINQDYLKYYFQSSYWHKYVKGIANYGARHDRISISDEDFFAIPIPLPPNEEQAAIVEVLSTADRELDLLRQDIEQEKQKKKALMQLLLTGIVRVNV